MYKLNNIACVCAAILLCYGCSNEVTDTEGQLREWISTLSSDEFEGRKPGTNGGQLTKNYIADQLKKLNIEPLGNSYFVEVPATQITLKNQSYVTLSFRGQDRKLNTGKEIVFWTKHAKEYRKLRDSQLVFVGYGIVAPEYNWNDYEGIDVQGKNCCDAYK